MNKTIFIVLALVFVSATIYLVTFMGGFGPPLSTFRIRPSQDTLLFAVPPWGESKRMKEAYTPLFNYLSEKFGKKLQLLIMEDYDTSVTHILEGDIDIFLLSPVSYVVAKEKDPHIQYIATQMRESQGKRFATYKGYLVALASKYKNFRLDDFLKSPQNYAIGFVTKKSSSGYAYPMAMMKKKGIDPFQVFKQATIFENHVQVTDAIAQGEIDIGATWEYNLEEAQKKHGDIFMIIETTAEIPGIAWVASKNVDPKLVEKFRAALLDLNTAPVREKLLKETPDKGWEIVPESFYDQVREVVKYVGAFE